MSKSTPTPIKDWMKKRKPAWFSSPTLALLLVVIIFATMIAWREPLSGLSLAAPTLEEEIFETTASPEFELKEPTPIPQEWEDNFEQTNGIIMGSVILVLIVVGGTLSAIRRRV